MNKDLILRERLAIQRTHMANQSTLLSFLRTSMYFFVAGFSIENLLDIENKKYIPVVFFIISSILFIYGFINFFVQRRWVRNNEHNVGDYKQEYLMK
ncbi:MAG: DUF202 domain-containing protein [Flavobacterium sp.]|nr:DUF202 domain-containing protein [Candidatus Neoflavobacterium equi]